MKFSFSFLATTFLFFFLGFSQSIAAKSYKDPSTQSNYDSVRVLHYDLSLEINPELHFKKGSEKEADEGYRGRVFYSIQALKPLRKISLDAIGLKIGQVKFWGLGKNELRRTNLKSESKEETLTYVVEKGAVHIELPKPMKPKQYALLSIEVLGASYDGGLYFVPPTATGSKVPAAFTQLEDIDARKVIPCQDTPQVHSSFRTEIKSPSKFLSFASGELKVQKKAEEGKLVRIFDTDFTIPIYLYALAVGNLKKTDLSKSLEVVYEPQHEKAAIDYAKDADEIVRYYEEYLSTPFPLPKLRIAFIPGFPWGGMENMGFIFLQERFLVHDNVRLPNGISVLPHEIVHHWYGNSVTMADRRHIFVNEGPTSFLDMEYLEDTLQQSRIDALWQRPRLASFSQEFNQRRDPKWGSMLSNPEDGSSPNFNDRYDKGSWVFRELRYLIGRDGVRNVLSNILPKTEGEKKLLTVKDFFQEIKRETLSYAKKNQIQLFDGALDYIEALILKPGHPELLVQCKRDKQGFLTGVTLFQPRSRKNADGSVRHGFIYPIGPMEYKFAFGKRTHRFASTAILKEDHQIKIPGKVTAFYLDPKGQRFVDIRYGERCFDLGKGLFVDVEPVDHRILSELDSNVDFVRVLKDQISEKASRAKTTFSNYLKPFPPKVSALLRVSELLDSENALKRLNNLLTNKDVPLRLETSKALFSQINRESLNEPETWSKHFFEALDQEKAYRIQAYWYANALLVTPASELKTKDQTLQNFYASYLPLPGWDTLFENIRSLAKRSTIAVDYASQSLLKFGATKDVPIPTAQLNMLSTLKEFSEDSVMHDIFARNFLTLSQTNSSIQEKYKSFFFATDVTKKQLKKATNGS